MAKVMQETEESYDKAAKVQQAKAEEKLALVRRQNELEKETLEVERIKEEFSNVADQHYIELIALNDQLLEQANSEVERLELELTGAGETPEEEPSEAERIQVELSNVNHWHKIELGALDDQLARADSEVAHLKLELTGVAELLVFEATEVERVQEELLKVKDRHKIEVGALNDQLARANSEVAHLELELKATKNTGSFQLQSLQRRLAEAESLVERLGKEHSGTRTSLILSVAFVVCIAVYVAIFGPSVDPLCGPAVPGTVIGSTQSGFLDAPWWAPDSYKESAFEFVCGKQRTRSRLDWSNGRLTVFSLNFKSGRKPKTIWTARMVGAIAGSESVILKDGAGSTTNIMNAPWAE
jgi:hypothetical protein